MRENEYLHTITSLANGIDPTTGEVFPAESPYQQTTIIRALFYAVQELTQKKEQVGNRGKLWSLEEEKALIERFNTGMNITQMSQAHDRSYGAIKSRLVKLKLIAE